jgi:hypothetical protein
LKEGSSSGGPPDFPGRWNPPRTKSIGLKRSVSLPRPAKGKEKLAGLSRRAWSQPCEFRPANKRPNARWDLVESPSRFRFSIEHDLFGKPLHTFPDHALAHAAGHEAPDKDLAVKPQRPNHRPSYPVRFGDHGVVGNVDPDILEADSIVAALWFPIDVTDSKAVRERTT